MVEKYSQNYKPKHIKSLCSFMYVNNEVGTINSIKELAKEVHEKGGLIHSDMVQALGHIPIDVQELDVDFASFSGHKIGAPKGVGFLYAKHPYYLKNTLVGGEQESGYRAGTENVAGIVGLGKACEIVQMSLSRNLKVYEALYTRLLFEIDNMPGVYINCVLHNRVENIVNLQVKDVQASQLVEYMNENEIYVSSGSACTSTSGKSSHVLTAFGCSSKEANESIRISFNPHNTYKEVDEFIKVLKEFIKIVRNFE